MCCCASWKACRICRSGSSELEQRAVDQDRTPVIGGVSHGKVAPPGLRSQESKMRKIAVVVTSNLSLAKASRPQKDKPRPPLPGGGAPADPCTRRHCGNETAVQ